MSDNDSARKGIVGRLYATLISSICCIIPLILLIMGIELTAGLVISGYRVYFIIAGIIFTGIYIFIHIRKELKKRMQYSRLVRRRERFIMSTVFTFALGLMLMNFLAILSYRALFWHRIKLLIPKPMKA